MHSRYDVLLIVLYLLAGSAARPAHAEQTRVGKALVVENEVVRVATPATSQVNVVDSMLRDEIVRTGADSAARSELLAATRLITSSILVGLSTGRSAARSPFANLAI